MPERAVITGLGTVVPTGVGKGSLWEATLAGRTATRPVSKFDTRGFEGAHAGEIEGFEPTDFMPTRLARKLDPFSHYAVAACQLAIDDAGVDVDDVDRHRFGVYVGNCFGGWEFTDRELRHLHTRGVGDLSAFQATAWFPAAPQGQVSILLGLRGHSKTVVCDRASGLVSVALGARAIADGQCDLMLVGGAEALITPFAYMACVTEGLVDMGDRNGGAAAYRPFDVKRGGLIPGEGAAFLMLESEAHASARGAHVYAEVAGTGMTNDACHPSPLPPEERGLSEAMEHALRRSGLSAEAIALVLADAIADPEGDRQEAVALRKVFGARHGEVAVTAPKSGTGHLYGAAGALDVAWAALAMQHGVVPPTPGFEERDTDCEVGVSAEPREREIGAVMVNARGSGGINSSVVLSQSRAELAPDGAA